MSTYFPKYSEIEAVLYDGKNYDAVKSFGGDSITKKGNSVFVTTNNGQVELIVGHYLCKGVSDFYPCDPTTFAARWQIKPYEVVIDRTAIMESDDALVWAEQFVKAVNQRPTIATDQATMVGWFANAMQNAISFNRERRAMDQKLIADLTQSPTE